MLFVAQSIAILRILPIIHLLPRIGTNFTAVTLPVNSFPSPRKLGMHGTQGVGKIGPPLRTSDRQHEIEDTRRISSAPQSDLGLEGAQRVNHELSELWLAWTMSPMLAFKKKRSSSSTDNSISKPLLPNNADPLSATASDVSIPGPLR